MGPAILVTQHPGALTGVQLVDEGHIQGVQSRDQTGDQIGFCVVLGLGLHLDGVLFGGTDHIIPQGGNALFQLRGRELPQVRIGIQLQPQKQCFAGEHVLLPGVHGQVGVPEIVEVGPEGAPLVFRPGVAHFLVQMAQKLGVVAGAAELDAVDPGVLVKVQKFVVGPNPGFVGHGGHDPADIAGNPGSVVVAQHADPLVALLNIEIAQVFIAQNGVGNARIAQMGGAQADPFHGKFAFGVQQGLKSGGKGGDAAGGLGAHDPLRGNLDEAHIHHGFGGVFRQQLVQHSGMGGLAGGCQFLVFFLTGLQGLDVFIRRHLCIHGSLQTI